MKRKTSMIVNNVADDVRKIKIDVSMVADGSEYRSIGIDYQFSTVVETIFTALVAKYGIKVRIVG